MNALRRVPAAIIRRRRVPVAEIQAHVAAGYDLAPADLLSARRTARLVRPRHVAMFLARTMAPLSMPVIGRHFGGRDHTIVLNAVRRIEALATADPAFGDEIAALRRMLEGPLLTVVLFPRRPKPPTPDSGAPILTASLDVLKDYTRLVAARAAGEQPPTPTSMRAEIVRFAAEALLHLEDFDRGGAVPVGT